MAAETSRRRDLRRRGILVTLLAVVATGALFSQLPENYRRLSSPPTEALPETPPETPPEQTAATAPEAEAPQATGSPAQLTGRQAELKQQLDQRYEQAVTMLHAGRYAYALVALENVLEIAPQLPEAWANAGYAYIGLEQHESARAAFLHAIDLRPQLVNAYYGLALAEEGLGNMLMAIAAMESYLHQADEDDPYLRKAESAVWEWREAQRNRTATAQEPPAEESPEAAAEPPGLSPDPALGDPG